jgi:NADPH:quinone reductase-like Zn-dependent oxidoreductase
VGDPGLCGDNAETMTHFLLQIAKAKGAYVVSTCSPATQAFVSSLGADATIDYHSVQPSLPAYLTATYPVSGPDSFDLILDTVGFSVNELYAACPAFLKPGGIYLDIAGNAHINDLSSALGSLVSTANRLFRPSWLGGTERTYKSLSLPAAEVVRLSGLCG